jgi:hypothetical protein
MRVLGSNVFGLNASFARVSAGLLGSASGTLHVLGNGHIGGKGDGLIFLDRVRQEIKLLQYGAPSTSSGCPLNDLLSFSQIKSNFLRFFLWRFHQLADCIKDDFELVVISFLQFGDFLGKNLMRANDLSQVDECPHYIDTYVYCSCGV